MNSPRCKRRKNAFLPTETYVQGRNQLVGFMNSSPAAPLFRIDTDVHLTHSGFPTHPAFPQKQSSAKTKSLTQDLSLAADAGVERRSSPGPLFGGEYSLELQVLALLSGANDIFSVSNPKLSPSAKPMEAFSRKRNGEEGPSQTGRSFCSSSSEGFDLQEFSQRDVGPSGPAPPFI
ncbi:hypothetical protein CB1_000844010 [Camelus ferus]|nr:hypothetical protein CB1_000844010 [Camelus ferus]